MGAILDFIKYNAVSDFLIDNWKRLLPVGLLAVAAVSAYLTVFSKSEAQSLVREEHNGFELVAVKMPARCSAMPPEPCKFLITGTMPPKAKKARVSFGGHLQAAMIPPMKVQAKDGTWHASGRFVCRDGAPILPMPVAVLVEAGNRKANLVANQTVACTVGGPNAPGAPAIG